MKWNDPSFASLYCLSLESSFNIYIFLIVRSKLWLLQFLIRKLVTFILDQTHSYSSLYWRPKTAASIPVRINCDVLFFDLFLFVWLLAKKLLLENGRLLRPCDPFYRFPSEEGHQSCPLHFLFLHFVFIFLRSCLKEIFYLSFTILLIILFLW